MTWAGVAIGGASLVGGLISAQGSKSAAETQAAAQEQAAQTQMNMYNTTTKQEQPFMQSGYAASAALNNLMGLKNTGYNNTYTPPPAAKGAPSGNPTVNGPEGRAVLGVLSGGNPLAAALGTKAPGASSFLSNLPGLATGGQARGGQQGRTYVVGEQGPEILQMAPGSKGYVHPNLETVMRMGNIPGRANGGPVGATTGDGNLTGMGLMANGAPTYQQALANQAARAQANNGFMSQPVQGQAAGSLTQGYGNFNFNPMDVSKMPGYQFQLQQGDQAIQNSDSANQGALSGATMKDMDTFNQQLAAGNENQYYNQALASYQTNQGNYYTSQNNIFNRLSSIASMGQNAAGNLGSVGSSLGSGVAQAQAAAGGSLAGGQLGAANAYAGAASNVPLYALMAGNGGGMQQQAGSAAAGAQ